MRAAFIAALCAAGLVCVTVWGILLIRPTPPPTPAPGGDVYCVSTSGSDANAGTLVSPFATLAKGVSVLAPGDTLYVRGGTYLQTSRLSVSASGTVSAPVTISGYPGETAIISGDVNANRVCETSDTPGSQWSSLVRLGGSHIVFRDFDVRFSGGRGIVVSGTYSTVSGCAVHHSYDMGIYLAGAHNTVEDCDVYRCTEWNYNGEGPNWSAGIGIGNMAAQSAPGIAPYSVIRNNTVYHNWGEGILVMNTDYSLIEGNTVYDNWAEQIYNDRGSYCTIQRNLAYWTGDTTYSRFGAYGPVGLELSNEAGQLTPDSYPIAHDVKLLNNIVVGCRSNIVFWKGEIDGSALINYLIAGNTCVNATSKGLALDAPYSGTHSGTRICNNLFLQTLGTSGTTGSTTGLTFDHNLWSKTPGPGCSGTGDIIGNPLLADPNHALSPGQVSPGWYKLTSSSPARAAGVAIPSITTDFFGGVRIVPPDIGAHQYTP